MKRFKILLYTAIIALIGLLIRTPAFAVGTCTPVSAGNYTLNATDGSCSFSAANPGVDTATGANTAKIIIPDTYTLTVAAGTTIAAGGLTINPGGQIALNGTMQIGANIYLPDADTDGYPDSTTATISHTPLGAGYTKRWAVPHPTEADCYTSANVYPGQTAFFTTQRGDGSWDYDCSGGITYQYQICSCAVCSANTCPYSCVLNTATVGHTCGVSESSGPSTCSMSTDGYGNCTSCADAGSASYLVACH